MKKRRVLHVNKNIHGGSAAVVYRIAQGLDGSKYESVVAFNTNLKSHFTQMIAESGIREIHIDNTIQAQLAQSTKPPVKQRNIADKIEAKLGKKARDIYLSIKSFVYFIQHEVPKIRTFVRVIRVNRIDLVHTHNDLNFGKPEIIAAWITGAPCVSHTHAFHFLSYFDMLFVNFVRSFIYISSQIANYSIAQGKPSCKGIIIHNGVDMADFLLSYDSLLVRKELGVNSNEFAVGIIGRIEWWKGHEYFIEAIAKIKNNVPSIKGLIIGELEENVSVETNLLYLKKVQYLVTSLGLTESIIFTGFRGDIPRVIDALDVVVHASSSPEPFGLVVIEAMAAGKPVIATAAGGVLDIIEDQVNGILIPCKDSEAIAQAVLKILHNKDEALSMGVAARQRVADRFTVERQVRAVEKLYDSILEV